VLPQLTIMVLQQHLRKDKRALQVRQRSPTLPVEFSVQGVRDVQCHKTLEVSIDLSKIKAYCPTSLRLIRVTRLRIFNLSRCLFYEEEWEEHFNHTLAVCDVFRIAVVLKYLMDISMQSIVSLEYLCSYNIFIYLVGV
jgi:hypothetical protein